METFWDVWGKRLINRRHIREARLEVKADKTRNTIVTLEDGERINMPGDYLSEVAQTASIVPAEPGFLSLRYWAESDFVDENPIIAWRIEGAGVVPITPDWCANDEHDESVIQYPDGRVIAPGDRAWPDRAEWEKAEREEAAAKAAQAAE